jgi:DNA-binding HxlR family transcriptional regulator
VDGPRSDCPINLSLEIFGDKWSLLILRDIIFGGKRHFRELLHSEEGIASNILAERLRMLTREGIISKAGDPGHRQKVIYSLTEKGIDLLPVLAQIAAWGRKHLPVSEEFGIRAKLLEKGGTAMWNEFMSELREAHLRPAHGARRPSGSRSVGVAARLQVAYERAVKKRERSNRRRVRT